MRAQARPRSRRAGAGTPPPSRPPRTGRRAAPATAAIWLKVAVHEVELVCSLATTCAMGAGMIAVAEPPARHRVGLREAVEHDRPAAPCPGMAAIDTVLAVVEDARVDLVGEDGHAVLAPPRPRSRAAPLSGMRAARRVVRVVQDDEPRLAAPTCVAELVHVERRSPSPPAGAPAPGCRRCSGSSTRRSGSPGSGRAPRRPRPPGRGSRRT